MTSLRLTRRLILVLALLPFSGPSLASDAPAKNLVGRWQLTELDGKAPPRFLQEKLLVLREDGTIRTEDLKPASKSAVLDAAATAVQTGKWRLADGRLWVASQSSRLKATMPLIFAESWSLKISSKSTRRSLPSKF